MGVIQTIRRKYCVLIVASLFGNDVVIVEKFEAANISNFGQIYFPISVNCLHSSYKKDVSNDTEIVGYCSRLRARPDRIGLIYTYICLFLPHNSNLKSRITPIYMFIRTSFSRTLLKYLDKAIRYPRQGATILSPNPVRSHNHTKHNSLA
jgi:hypothetical protein